METFRTKMNYFLEIENENENKHKIQFENRMSKTSSSTLNVNRLTTKSKAQYKKVFDKLIKFFQQSITENDYEKVVFQYTSNLTLKVTNIASCGLEIL